MKRNASVKHLRKHDCYIKREGQAPSFWCNPLTGRSEAITRHTKIPNRLAEKISAGLSIPEIS